MNFSSLGLSPIGHTIAAASCISGYDGYGPALVLMDSHVLPKRRACRRGQCRLHTGYGRHLGKIHCGALRIFGNTQALFINQTQVKIRPGASEASRLTVPVQSLRPAFDDGMFLAANYGQVH